MTAHFTAPPTFPSPTGEAFTTYPDLRWDCPDSGCPVNGPGCNMTVVGQQCTWPESTAQALCLSWAECAGVICQSGSGVCQARGPEYILYAWPGRFNTSFRSAPFTASGATVDVHYEIYDGLPILKKWVSVLNAAGNEPLGVDSMIMEQLRAPNFAPEQMYIIRVQAGNDFPSDQQVAPIAANGGGRAQPLWTLDPLYDLCCDASLHVPWTYYTLLSVGYGYDVAFGGRTGPGAIVLGGGTFTSIAVRTVLYDSRDPHRQSLTWLKVQSRVAPQLSENPMYYMFFDVSSTAAFRLALDQASVVGYEMAIVGFGADGFCGLCAEQTQNATWVAWFKEQVDYGKSVGVGVSAYTLMQANGWGEGVPEVEQILQRDGTRGGIACFATDWHAAYRQDVLTFAAAVGMEGVETDGQYENAPCMDDTGDHHHNGLLGSWDAQVNATALFNIGLKEEGLFQSGADAYEWSGANHWNHADTDAGFGLPSWERLTNVREYIYDSTFSRLATSGSMFVPNAGDCNDTSSAPTPGRRVCIDWGMASTMGMGVNANWMGVDSLWDPADPDAAYIQARYTNWTALFNAYRPILTSWGMHHLSRPTGRSYDALAHVAADSGDGVLAWTAVYNPTRHAVVDSVSLPLYYAGVPPGTNVTVSTVSPSARAPTFLRTAVVGQDGGAIWDVTLPFSLDPFTYGFFLVTRV